MKAKSADAISGMVPLRSQVIEVPPWSTVRLCTAGSLFSSRAT